MEIKFNMNERKIVELVKKIKKKNALFYALHICKL